MTVMIDVWSDFVCPWCYLATTSLEKLAETHDILLKWHSFELRPPDAPPISPEYMARIEAARPRMAAMAREHYGIDMMPGRVNDTSRDSLIGEKIAAVAGLGNEFHHALMEAYWQEEIDIADREVLANVAGSIGMDRADFLEKLDDQEMEQAVLADIMLARQYGLSGVPAMIINQKYLVSGAQPYEALVNALEQVALAEAEA